MGFSIEAAIVRGNLDLTCPDFPRAPDRGHSIYHRYDRAVIGWAPFPGWGNVGPQMAPDGSAVHSTS